MVFLPPSWQKCSAGDLRYVKFGGIDGDGIFPWGVKAAGYITFRLNGAGEFRDVALAVGSRVDVHPVNAAIVPAVPDRL